MDVYDFQGGGGIKSLLAIPENQMKQIEAVDKNSRLHEFMCMVARALKREIYPAGGVGQKEFEGAVEAIVNEIGGKYISFHRLMDFIFMMLPSGELGERIIRGIVKACKALSPLQFINYVTALARQ
uniref:Uncharacterized protein n=1 Tax=Chromera velia CCMP2878 TaxID=1169474 RepID=A0A0G4GR03_9ALVE|eukprot:Cvel_5049.t1-p1 / transcript=Cvel_5049.t1 / gene=Cvel_5049 / organism=Chromera_velia_CCMP2878 / gene_product=hypothetical protein / transcript_product=hypothetical protein / location=Cvel_scaffold230:34649-35191(+) / protein_length=125 / sequence_SO=supercontig / SO=protein_coding / is_pseudo=false